MIQPWNLFCLLVGCFFFFVSCYLFLFNGLMHQQMFTNGMSESISSDISIRDVSEEAFKAMLDFMYCGELNFEENPNPGTLLLELLVLADQFGVTLLHQECCKILLECLSEVVM